MKNAAVFILLFLLSFSAFAQTRKPAPGKTKNSAAVVDPAAEKEEFDKAVAVTDVAERIAALLKFNEKFPKSSERNRALELIASARAALGDEKLRSGEKESGIEFFTLAVREAPQPLSDKFFTDIIIQIPNSLLFRGERAAAGEIARLIGEKVDGNAQQMLTLATFYLGTENAFEMRRLTEKALVLEPNLPAAYQTLGIVNRLDFQLEESANAYAKALELAPNSNVSKRSLAEMKRATGKPAEAAALYREVLAKDENDGAAQTGLILALFDADKKSEAENALSDSLARNPNNLFLLVGAAYWYAAHNDGARAVELAEKAVAVEPRYTWARIALARGLMQQKRLLEAEKALLAARQFGDFPTLEYELAAARLQAGFYREAAEGLQKKFVVKDGSITALLGGRVNREAKNFTELLAAERRASIFQPAAADDADTADKLKSLLDFSLKLENSDGETTSGAADEFVKGDDQMKLHRQLYAANQLLEKRKSLAKVLELTKAAVGGVDAALNAPNPAAAVLADELYQSRRIAIARNELIIVPEVSRQMLSNILRGRIEDITGWTLFQESKSSEAVTRLKRAVSILPEKSSWWRNSMWRLGSAQESAGNQKEALDSYLKSYARDEGDAIKYTIIESVYQKVNGSTDGLEAQIGAKPALSKPNFLPPTERKTIEQPKAELTPAVPTEIAPTETVPAATEVPPVKETPPVVETPATTKTNTPTEVSKPNVSLPDEPTAPPETAAVVSPPETKSETKTGKSPKSAKVSAKRPKINAEPSAETVSKPLFEPIVISVPKVSAAETKPSPEPIAAETPEPEATPEAIPETTSESKADEIKLEKKPSGENIESRPRVFIQDDLVSGECTLTVSRAIVSLINNGGNSTVTIGVDGAANVRNVKAISSSSSDVEITAEPETSNRQPSRALFTIKSISPKTGTFLVTFESSCGSKEIIVQVR